MPTQNTDDLIRACALAITSAPVGSPYTWLPERARHSEQQANTRGGPPELESLRRGVLLSTLNDPRFEFPPYTLTDEVTELWRASRHRIRNTCEHAPDLHYAIKPDLYQKDLAIVQARMFPSGARVVEAHSGLPRRLLTAQGLPQAWRFARLLLSMGGKAPLYQLHVHLDELEEFTQPGWARTLGRLARMLVIHPEVRGVFVAGWLYDPALPGVSPRMGYIRTIARDAGAEFFYSSVDTSGSAFAKSPTRRKLFEEGRYVPKSYYTIWPRRRLVKLARDW